jgi:hypothetical protein
MTTNIHANGGCMGPRNGLKFWEHLDSIRNLKSSSHLLPTYAQKCLRSSNVQELRYLFLWYIFVPVSQHNATVWNLLLRNPTTLFLSLRVGGFRSWSAHCDIQKLPPVQRMDPRLCITLLCRECHPLTNENLTRQWEISWFNLLMPNDL